MTPQKKKGAKLLGVSILCAFIAFFGFFTTVLPHLAASGVMLLGLVGFLHFFNKGYDLYSNDAPASGEQADGTDSGVSGPQGR